MTQYWLMKSEPDAYSWDDLLREGKTLWTGVRNHQAANHMRAMRKGDQAFFYHSRSGLEIVGTMQVSKEAMADPTDDSGRWVVVEVKPLKALPQKVSLKAIKATEALGKMAILRQSRLSVAPVAPDEWQVIIKMGGLL